jgi:CRISPR/Cas system CMR subunit Cmr6 (Cas7 group RAMP superfamily)
MADDKIYRFKPEEKTFYDERLYRTTNQYGEVDYLDISVPMAPNHHFSPIGEVVKFKGHENVKQSETLEEVHTKLEEIEQALFAEDPAKGKVFWMDAFKIMEEKKVNDPLKVLEALKVKEEKSTSKK